MAIYQNFEELVAALDSAMNEGRNEDAKKLGKLVNVYFDAKHSCKDAIGVGAITYAQDVLVAYQLANGVN